MSAKIKLSYENTPELLAVIAKLGKIVTKVRPQPPKGRYHLAYLDVELLPCSSKTDTIKEQ